MIGGICVRSPNGMYNACVAVYKTSQSRVGDLGAAEEDFDNFSLLIPLDPASPFLPRGNGITIGVCSVTSAPDDPHHQQQTQRTLHGQLHRLEYPDGANIEAGEVARGYLSWPQNGSRISNRHSSGGYR